ncbi:MAG: CRTAC1 family protein, partial [Phycisphaerae bacterium]
QRLTIILALLAGVTGALVWRRADVQSAASPTAATQPPEAAAPQAPAPVFVDATTAAGLDFVHECGAAGKYEIPEEMGAGGAFIDYDNDGDLDIYLVQSGALGTDNATHRNRLYRNDGAGRFTDVSDGSGADVPGYGMGCAAVDYDNDGDIDLYVTRIGPNVLLRNDGDGTFSDATATAGVGDPGFSTAAAFLDYDRDGRLDLYVSNYVQCPSAREQPCWDSAGHPDYCNPIVYGPAADRLYRNTGDGRFEDVTSAALVGQTAGNGLGLLCSDFNGDGWIDIYVANDQTPAMLWINQGDGRFAEEAGTSGCAYNADGRAIAGMGTAAEDLDGDGTFDLVVTNIHSQPHLCLLNRGGFFEDAGHALGFGGWGVPYTAFGLALFDQDHDGVLDGFFANGAVNRLNEPYRAGHRYAEPNQFVRRDARGRFYDASAEAALAAASIEMSRGVIAGDYDNDGDLDLLVTNNRGPARLLRNECAAARAWIMLDVVGRHGGRHAINARLELHTAGRTQVREVRPHSSYLSSHDPRVHVGLGDATEVERLVVRWPGGDEQAWEHLPVNRLYVIEFGKPPRAVLRSGAGS